jgi:hypothetical protein
VVAVATAITFPQETGAGRTGISLRRAIYG